MSAALQVNEIFSSPQGEGAISGIPMLFVRLYRCNLDCPWCDQPSALSTRPGASYREMMPEEVCDAVESSGLDHVCFTGGEPFFQHDGLRRTLDILDSRMKPCDRLKTVVLETNGTMYVREVVSPRRGFLQFLMSISPKPAPGTTAILGASGRAARRIEMHGQGDVLRWIRDGIPKQLKFVVESREQFMSYLRWLEEHVGEEDAKRIDLCFQPEWFGGREEFKKIVKEEVGAAARSKEFSDLLRVPYRSIRFLPQGHKALGLR